MSKFLIQYTIDVPDLTVAQGIAYKLLYQSQIEVKDVKVTAADPPSVVTFDEPLEATEAREVSSDIFQKKNEDYKRDHPWGI